MALGEARIFSDDSRCCTWFVRSRLSLANLADSCAEYCLAGRTSFAPRKGSPMQAMIYTRAITAHLLLPQITACRSYAEAVGMHVGLVLSDLDDGVSLKRPGLAALRARAAEQQFEAVIVYDSYILSRSLDDMNDLTHELEAAGLQVHVLAG